MFIHINHDQRIPFWKAAFFPILFATQRRVPLRLILSVVTDVLRPWLGTVAGSIWWLNLRKIYACRCWTHIQYVYSGPNPSSFMEWHPLWHRQCVRLLCQQYSQVFVTYQILLVHRFVFPWFEDSMINQGWSHPPACIRGRVPIGAERRYGSMSWPITWIQMVDSSVCWFDVIFATDYWKTLENHGTYTRITESLIYTPQVSLSGGPEIGRPPTTKNYAKDWLVPKVDHGCFGHTVDLKVRSRCSTSVVICWTCAIIIVYECTCNMSVCPWNSGTLTPLQTWSNMVIVDILYYIAYIVLYYTKICYIILYYIVLYCIV